MSSQTATLQGDVLTELVLGVPLPTPALDREHIEIILDLLQRAYDEVKLQHHGSVATCDEKHMNALMEGRLNALVRSNPLYEALVLAVSRGSERTNYDATHMENRPDIQIKLTNRLSPFSLIVECKILDKPHQKTIDLYCDNGLLRFVNGQYAWENREAVMLAYVRDGSNISNTLHPFLSAAGATSTNRYKVAFLPQKRFSLPDAACSLHERSFTYVHSGQAGQAPGDILVWHLWVS